MSDEIELIFVRDNIYKRQFPWNGKPHNRYYIKTTCFICEGETFQERRNFRKYTRAFCSKECRHAGFSGVNNPNWREGRKSKRGKNGGHILVYAPDHPQARKGFVPEHRLVMERKLGRLLTEAEKVHHKNLDMQDNADSNLVVTNNIREHNKVHASLLKCVKPLMELGYLIFNENSMIYEVSQ